MLHITSGQQIYLFLCPVLPAPVSLISAEASSASKVDTYSRKSSKSPTACTNETGSFPVFVMLSVPPVSSFGLLWVANSDSCHFFRSHMWWYVNRKKIEVPNYENSCSDEAHWVALVWSAGDSPSAGVHSVYTLSVVTVAALSLVSVKVWKGRCDLGHDSSYVCENVEKNKSEGRKTQITRETLL